MCLLCAGALVGLNSVPKQQDIWTGTPVNIRSNGNRIGNEVDEKRKEKNVEVEVRDQTSPKKQCKGQLKRKPSG